MLALKHRLFLVMLSALFFFGCKEESQPNPETFSLNPGAMMLAIGEGNFRRHRGVKHPNDEWQQQKHDQTADAVQDRHEARQGKTVGRQVRDCVDVAELRPLLGKLGHVVSFFGFVCISKQL